MQHYEIEETNSLIVWTTAKWLVPVNQLFYFHQSIGIKKNIKELNKARSTERKYIFNNERGI